MTLVLACGASAAPAPDEAELITLTREVIKIESVTGRVEGDFGYLRISTFNENTGRELNEAIAKIKAEKPGVKGYVLDLRNNGGGLLDAAEAGLRAGLAHTICRAACSLAPAQSSASIRAS